MFTYIDPSVRTRLLAQGKLTRINAAGVVIDATSADVPAEPALEILGPIPMPVALSEEPLTVQWYAFVRRTELARVDELAAELREQGGQHLFASLTSSMAVNSLLVIGDPDPSREPLVRVHSNCLTGDVFGSKRCDCGPQLAAAVRQIQSDPAGGYLVYMAGHEGRGIGLWAKAATYLLQDADGQILEGHSISAGLDYPGIGPEHAWLKDMGRVEYVSITDDEALSAFQTCCALEGIIPALEPSHALAHVLKIAPDLPADHLLIMNMCGRGDKDIFTVAQHLGVEIGS